MDLWFETVHSFSDDNGRLGRAIIDRAISQEMRAASRLHGTSMDGVGLRDKAGIRFPVNLSGRWGQVDPQHVLAVAAPVELCNPVWSTVKDRQSVSPSCCGDRA
jgi:hypothetical protein